MITVRFHVFNVDIVRCLFYVLQRNAASYCSSTIDRFHIVSLHLAVAFSHVVEWHSLGDF